MSEEDSNNNAQITEEQNGTPSKRNKNAVNDESRKSEEPHSESANAPRVEPNLFTLVVHAILESDRNNGVRFDAIWKFIKSHFGVENERRKLVRATVDEALEAGELIEDDDKKIHVNFATKVEADEDGAENEGAEDEGNEGADDGADDEGAEDDANTAKAGKKRRTKRPAMKKGSKRDEIEEDVEAEPATPRRGRKRTREASVSRSPSPKKRGRPAKRAKTAEASDVTDTPRRRGRPAKHKQVEQVEDASEAEEVVEETPKRRGRPPSKKGKSPQRGRAASPAKKNAASKKSSPSKSPKKSPNKSPNKKHKSPSKGAELDLPKGWRVEEVVRKGGRTEGRSDQYWYSPEGIKFRSRVAVLRHLEEQQ